MYKFRSNFGTKPVIHLTNSSKSNPENTSELLKYMNVCHESRAAMLSSLHHSETAGFTRVQTSIY